MGNQGQKWRGQVVVPVTIYGKYKSVFKKLADIGPLSTRHPINKLIKLLAKQKVVFDLNIISLHGVDYYKLTYTDGGGVR